MDRCPPETIESTESADGQLFHASPCSALPPVLDATCGSRAMWFNKDDPRAIFHDKRTESLEIPPGKAWPKGTTLHIRPDVEGSFCDMPFPDCSFRLVVFDPPHYEKMGAGDGSNMHRFYGRLLPDWETDLAEGFKECMRVLMGGGVLVFKWCSVEIPLSRVLKLAPDPPLFGHTTGRREKTHWMTFMKPLGVESPEAIIAEALEDLRDGESGHAERTLLRFLQQNVKAHPHQTESEA